jgi:hypothetical protein
MRSVRDRANRAFRPAGRPTQITIHRSPLAGTQNAAPDSVETAPGVGDRQWPERSAFSPPIGDTRQLDGERNAACVEVERELQLRRD